MDRRARNSGLIDRECQKAGFGGERARRRRFRLGLGGRGTTRSASIQAGEVSRRVLDQCRPCGAAWLAQWTFNPLVVGSNPTGGTEFSPAGPMGKRFVEFAQAETSER